MIDPQELLFAVDEENHIIDPVPRNKAHQLGIWHRSTNIWVVNGKQILCQKRSMLKDTNPGKWEVCFGGHLGPNEEYNGNAQRELAEELGLELPISEFTAVLDYKSAKDDAITGAKDREFKRVFVVQWSGNESDLSPEKEEVDEIMWMNASQIKDDMNFADKWIIQKYAIDLLDRIAAGEYE